MIPTWAERCEKFGDEIVTNAMIQQVMQEEIDELRKELALQRLSDIGQDIEQEPVAWAYIDELDNICEHGDWQINVTKTKEYSNQIGLFAYPNEDRESAIYATGYWNGIAKGKPCELTDEKIWKLWQTHLNDDITVFARAILKKASEK